MRTQIVRPSWLVFVVSLASLFAMSTLSACGRSSLGDLDTDAGPQPCRTNSDCAGTPATPVCDTTVGVCVAGCASDADCHAPTPYCRTDDHECVQCITSSECPSGQTCVNNACVGACGIDGSCPGSLRCCADLCLDTTGDPTNCGGCGLTCPPLANAVAGCNASTCGIGSCVRGFADCDRVAADGCEVNLNGDPANCGACGRACATGESCSGGTCVGGCGGGASCGSSLTCCGTSCEDTLHDPKNCGGCGIDCTSPPNGTGTCGAAKCTVAACSLGFANCNGLFADGCEVDTNTDSANCGSCGNVCAPGSTCSGGVCAGACGISGCGTGLSCCGSACKNVKGDPDNCSACGNVCPPLANATRACSAGACAIGSCNSGFADCNKVVSDGCEVNTQSDNANCGACGKACGAGQTCSAGVCTGGMTGCRVTGCAAGQTCCGTTCVDTNSDAANCGGCFDVCGPTTPVCKGGACCSNSSTGGTCTGIVCPSGQTNCGGVCVDETSDPNNCGGCGFACAPGQTCTASTCQNTSCLGGPACGAGQSCCDKGCTDERTDPTHCGSCTTRCGGAPSATATCTMGLCGFACDAGFADCDKVAVNGCEVNTQTDAANCGACGKACGSGQTCVSGSCTSSCMCTGSQICCGASTTCVDPTTDANNCGGCGVVCPSVTHAVPTCSMKSCGYACTGSWLDCNKLASDGCEIDGSSDNNNCGGCGIKCSSGQTCQAGSCNGGTEGAFDPMVNPTYLSPGIHNFTTINVPAGVVVYVAGSGPQSGTLDLRATGAIQIDGVIDVSGGPGSQNTITSRSTQQGRAGSGGYTGQNQTAPYGLACAFVVGNGGPNGSGPAGTLGSCPAGPTTCIAQTDPLALLFAAPVAQFGGGAGVFTGYRAYGSGGGGPAGGAPGALGAAYSGEGDCSGASGGGGAINGLGGASGFPAYDGLAGTLGQTECAGVMTGVPAAWVGGGGGGSIGSAAANDLAVTSTFQVGSGGGGGSADYLNRPVFGGTSGGGGGGGALRLSTPASIVINGQLLANGGDGGDAYIGNGSAAGCDPQPGAAGGGGSGGVIYLAAPSVNVSSSATISAAGGNGGFASVFATGGGGGNGGVGRIRLSINPSSCTLGGTFNPPLVSGCSATSTPVSGKAYVGIYPG